MTAIEALDRELERLHKELNTFTVTQYGDNDEYNSVLEAINTVNETLETIAVEEVKNPRMGQLTNAEVRLAVAWLKLAAQEFSRHSCNDIPKEILDLLTKEEWDNLERRFQIYNKTPNEYIPGKITHCDGAWMHFLAKRLESLL